MLFVAAADAGYCAPQRAYYARSSRSCPALIPSSYLSRTGGDGIHSWHSAMHLKSLPLTSLSFQSVFESICDIARASAEVRAAVLLLHTAWGLIFDNLTGQGGMR